MNFSDTDLGPRPEVSTQSALLRAIYFHGLAHATVKVAYMVVASQLMTGVRFPSPALLFKVSLRRSEGPFGSQEVAVICRYLSSLFGLPLPNRGPSSVCGMDAECFMYGG
jgi:hypothetical protein